MVDVSEKKDTTRTATATTYIDLPLNIYKELFVMEGKEKGEEKKQEGDERERVEIHGKKGPVFATSVVAGTMAVKNTSNLLPFCHPLGVLDCKFDIFVVGRAGEGERRMEGGDSELGENFGVRVRVDCEVKVKGKTGVEMEALTGVSVCGLCVYDMVKGLSHDIVIHQVCMGI